MEIIRHIKEVGRYFLSLVSDKCELSFAGLGAAPPTAPSDEKARLFPPLGFHYTTEFTQFRIFFYFLFFCFSVSEKFMGLFFSLFNCA